MNTKKYASAINIMLAALLMLSCETLMAAVPGHVAIQAGGFWAHQGEAQDINVQGVIGNHYTVSNQNKGNALIGLGYYLDGFNRGNVQFAYGLNAFYLGATSVSGTIAREKLDTNLSYKYDIQHIPLYFDTKAIIKTKNSRYNVTLDAGIGPNFMRTQNYTETPLNNTTASDNGFASHNNVAFSATAGIGLQFNNIFKNTPVECGYRFFYLGQGKLAKNNSLLISDLQTGNTYANVLLCSITL
jgi:hypothetical protein